MNLKYWLVVFFVFLAETAVFAKMDAKGDLYIVLPFCVYIITLFAAIVIKIIINKVVAKKEKLSARMRMWLCPKEGCGFRNNDMYVKCFLCGTPRPVNIKTTPTAPPVPRKKAPGQTVMGQAPSWDGKLKEGEWLCSDPECGTVNNDPDTKCFMCDKPRPVAGNQATIVAPPAAPVKLGWTCSACGSGNESEDKKCVICGEPRPEHVICSKCGKSFLQGLTHCNHCGQPVPEVVKEAAATDTKTPSTEEWECQCGTPVVGTNICPKCGTQLCKCGAIVESDYCARCSSWCCEKCGALVSPGDNFCGICGTEANVGPFVELAEIMTEIAVAKEGAVAKVVAEEAITRICPNLDCSCEIPNESIFCSHCGLWFCAVCGEPIMPEYHIRVCDNCGNSTPEPPPAASAPAPPPATVTTDIPAPAKVVGFKWNQLSPLLQEIAGRYDFNEESWDNGPVSELWARLWQTPFEGLSKINAYQINTLGFKFKPENWGKPLAQIERAAPAPEPAPVLSPAAATDIPPAPAKVLGKDWDQITKKQREIAKKLGFTKKDWNCGPVPEEWAKTLWPMPLEILNREMPHEYDAIISLGFTAENWGKPTPEAPKA